LNEVLRAGRRRQAAGSERVLADREIASGPLLVGEAATFESAFSNVTNSYAGKDVARYVW
jgi:hypothetical protein